MDDGKDNDDDDDGKSVNKTFKELRMFSVSSSSRICQ